MLKSMQITLPFPDSSLLPNRKNGRHWGSTSGAKSAARNAAYYLAKEAMQSSRLPQRDAYHLRITFMQPDRRKRDLDNLLAGMKNYLDGMCDALGIDDSKFDSVTLLRGYMKGNGHVVVTVTEGEQ